MEFTKFIDWAFLGLISGGMVFLISFLKGLGDGISLLNTQIAVIIERVEHHERRIGLLEKGE